jgi:hypothetical protein
MLDIDNESKEFHNAISALGREWSTSNQQFAIWLHASRKAKLLRCEPIAHVYRKTRFVFVSDIPSADLQFEFDTGECKVSIHQFFTAQYYVRKLVSQALAAEANSSKGTHHDNSRPSR